MKDERRSAAYLDSRWNLADDGDLLRSESDLFGGEIGDEDFGGGDFGHSDDCFSLFFLLDESILANMNRMSKMRDEEMKIRWLGEETEQARHDSTRELE
jgi:hypothetical protein